VTADWRRSKREEDAVKDGGEAIVLLPGEGRTIEIGAFDVTVFAEPSTAGGGFSLIETAEHEAGIGPPMHIHRDCAESFYVLAGGYEMFVDDRTFDCPAGSFIYVPKGTPHTFRNTQPMSRKLNLYTPSGMVGYFDELASGIRSGIDDAALDAIAEHYAMEVVGPVPERYLADPGSPRT
jgi:mannose-6-phosphate isomerase-like protein (cupin superfamily)